MIEGCVFRTLPDGGLEFVLDHPALSSVRVDRRSRLVFGRTQVAIRGPFTLEVGTVAHHLDPARRAGLGPLCALYPDTARWLWATGRGRLTVAFESGALLVVPSDPVTNAWSVGDTRCRPPGAG